MRTNVWKTALAAMAMMGASGCLFDPSSPYADIDKVEAERRMSDDPDSPDYCATQGWYNDGVCDTFCRQDDIDCDDVDDDCASDSECASGEYCKVDACGASDGTCTATGDGSCYEIWAPVCGCDGQTYSNDCFAQAAGVSIASEGECKAAACEPADCADQPVDLYVCEDGNDPYRECESRDGVCVWVDYGCQTDECTPQECGPEPDFAACPGGDGPTITCERDDVGVCGWRGECNERACGGFAGETCGEDEYCAFRAGEWCGFDDGSSVCRPRPVACTEEYAPVCGCDGVTYGNECAANAMGVGVFEIGECERPGECTLEECGPAPGVPSMMCADGSTAGPECGITENGVCGWTITQCEDEERSCGGFAGLTCERGEFCDYAETDMCGFADGLGVCRPRPVACPNVYEPVCGCDGKTYANECTAHESGVGVLNDGACSE